MSSDTELLQATRAILAMHMQAIQALIEDTRNEGDETALRAFQVCHDGIRIAVERPLDGAPFPPPSGDVPQCPCCGSENTDHAPHHTHYRCMDCCFISRSETWLALDQRRRDAAKFQTLCSALYEEAGAWRLHGEGADRTSGAYLMDLLGSVGWKAPDDA